MTCREYSRIALPALQAQRRARRPGEGPLDHRIGREQVSEAVGIAVQDQAAALGQDIGGRGGWHAASPSFGRFNSTYVD
jgi:hypothetical protein